MYHSDGRGWDAKYKDTGGLGVQVVADQVNSRGDRIAGCLL